MIRAVAVEAMVDPRTVERRLAAEPVRPSLAERIDVALAARGIAPSTPKP